MARRSQDVELVIKARDEAKRVLDSLNNDLAKLDQSQVKVGKSADKAGDLVNQLGAEFQDLNKQLQGLAVLGKIAGELNRATNAVDAIDTQVKSAAGSLADLARQSLVATQRANTLRGQLEAETRSRDENTDGLRRAKKELSDLDRLLRQVEKSQSKLNRENAAAQPTRGVGVEAGASQSSARASMSAFLADEQRRLTGEVQQYTSAVEKSKQAIKDLQPAVSAAAAQEQKLGAETDKAAGALRRQRTELADSKTNLSEIRTISEQANTRLGALAGTQEKVAAASARMASEMAAAKARIDALSSAKTPTIVAPQTTGIAGDEQALASQRRAMLEARREWLASQEAVKKLAQEMRAADQPTEELGAAFGRAQAQARLAAQEYDRQAQALHRLSGTTQSNFRAFSQAADQMRNAGGATRGLGADASAAAANQKRLAQSLNDTSASAGRAASGTNGFRSALGGIYGESRKAMSILQRIRGEVLSLITAYVGLHAAINQIGGVITAFQGLEAAQSRLGVVFNQDTGRVSSELAWLNSEAARLGITFQVLSDEYGKFAVAAKAANFSAENTREIFTSVAEAARVNKLSVDQMSGVFLALQQMISKGKVSSEELRRQLGDRLTGAFNIFAEAIGVTTAELDEMMRKGEVIANESTLIKFADELEKRFGPQLAAALRTSTTEMGRFWNEIFNAQLRVAEGGFMEALTNALRDLNQWFASRDGRDFFLSLGQALGTFVNVLAQVPKHLDLLKYAMLAVIGVKLGPSLAAINFQFTAASASTVTFAARLVALRAGVAAVATSVVTLRGVLIGIRGLMAGLLSVMGGIPGIVATIGLILATEWLTGIDDATSALDEHKRQIEAVQAAYLSAGKGVKDWAKEIKGVSELQAIDDLQKMRDQLTELRSLKAPGDAFGLDTRGTVASLKKAVEAFNAGTMSAADFKKEVDRIAAADPDLSRTIALQFQETADKAVKAEDAVARAEAKLRIIKGTATEADEALLGLSKAAQEASTKLNPENAKEFEKSLRGIKDEIPALSDEMKQLKEIDALDKLYQDALNLASTMGQVKEATDLYGRALDAIKNKDITKMLESFGAGGVSASNLIKSFESFHSQPYFDVNAYRVGYGSDTITLSDGTIRRVTEGMKVSVTDANRDLARRIGEFQDTIKTEIGSDRFAAFSAEQQAVLTSIAYNYGNLSRTGELQAFKTGTVDEIVAAIRRLAPANGGVNADRRNKEADIFAAGGTTYRLEQQRLQSEADLTKYVDERVQSLKEEADARKESTRELEIQKEINRAEKEAQKQGLQLSKEQIAAIREATGARWDAVHAGEADKQKIKETKEAIAEVVGLDQQRSNLLKEMALAYQQGDQGRLDQTKLQIEEINAKIAELLPNAQAMAQALGDEKMIAALQKVALNTDIVNQKVQTAASNVNFLGLNFQQMQQLGQSFASGIAGVFDKFAAAIANGEDAVGALKDAFLQFAADFLRQIAQMIIQQAILNALQAAFPGMGFGGTGGGILGAIMHGGGVVGRGYGGQRRTVSPSIFTNALRYHTGGVAGLKPDEVPTILQKNEEVLTTGDPRHRFNGGAAQQKAGDTKIINAFDTASFLEAALSTRIGEKAILNFVQANAGAIKGALG